MTDTFVAPGALAFEIEEPRDESLFVRGFQAGRIWELLQADPDALNGQGIPRPDAAFVLRMLATLGLTDVVTQHTSDDGFWLYLTGPNGGGARS